MASKKDLEARIEALESEIAQLRLQVAQKQQPVVLPAPSYPGYYGLLPLYDWYRPTMVWCDTTSRTVVHVGGQTKQYGPRPHIATAKPGA